MNTIYIIITAITTSAAWMITFYLNKTDSNKPKIEPFTRAEEATIHLLSTIKFLIEQQNGYRQPLIDNTAVINRINQNLEYLKEEYQKYFKPKTEEEKKQEQEFNDKIKSMKEILDVKVQEQLNGKP